MLSNLLCQNCCTPAARTNKNVALIKVAVAITHTQLLAPYPHTYKETMTSIGPGRGDGGRGGRGRDGGRGRGRGGHGERDGGRGGRDGGGRHRRLGSTSAAIDRNPSVSTNAQLGSVALVAGVALLAYKRSKSKKETTAVNHEALVVGEEVKDEGDKK